MIIDDSMWHDGVLERVAIDARPKGRELEIAVMLYPEPINAKDRKKYQIIVSGLIDFTVEGNLEEIIDNANAGNINSGAISDSELSIEFFCGSISARDNISANEL